MLRQAIVTKYHGPTDKRGSRISARCEIKRVFFGYDCTKNTIDNHRAAMRELVQQLGWGGLWHGGGLPDGSSYCWVMLPETGTMTDEERAAALFG